MIQAASPTSQLSNMLTPSNTSGTSEVGLSIGANLDYRMCVGNPVAASTEVFAKLIKQGLLLASGTKGEIKGLFRWIQSLAKCHSEYKMI